MTAITNRGDCLIVEYSGPTDPEHIIPLMQEAALECSRRGCQRILADLRQASTMMSLLDRFDLGVLGAEMFRGISQVAIVAPASEDNASSESVAVNRGLSARITADMDEALRWLGLD